MVTPQGSARQDDVDCRTCQGPCDEQDFRFILSPHESTMCVTHTYRCSGVRTDPVFVMEGLQEVGTSYFSPGNLTQTALLLSWLTHNVPACGVTQAPPTSAVIASRGEGCWLTLLCDQLLSILGIYWIKLHKIFYLLRLETQLLFLDTATKDIISKCNQNKNHKHLSDINSLSGRQKTWQRCADVPR